MPQRRRFQQTMDLSERLSMEADRLRDAAIQATTASEREALLHQARQYEGATHMEGWLRSDQRPPE